MLRVGDESLHCFYLSQADLTKICDKYPGEMIIFRRMIKERNKYYKTVISISLQLYSLLYLDYQEIVGRYGETKTKQRN